MIAAVVSWRLALAVVFYVLSFVVLLGAGLALLWLYISDEVEAAEARRLVEKGRQP